MKRYQGEVVVACPPEVAFDYFADMAHMTEWAPEDFVSVRREGEGAIAQGTRFAYVTKGARAESYFAWDKLDRPKELVFSGPRVDVGPGWVEGLGGYTFASAPGGTLLRIWLEPTLGGLLALVSPFARMRNIRVLGHQLARAKELLARHSPR
jgi:Polyketide cyclase / dehydrase and lipid transport